MVMVLVQKILINICKFCMTRITFCKKIFINSLQFQLLHLTLSKSKIFFYPKSEDLDTRMTTFPYT